MLGESIPGAGADARPRALSAADPLSRCVGVGFDEFAERLWGRRALYTAGAPDGFADLFSADAVDELVSRRGLRTPFLRMARDGSVLDEKLFTRSGGSGATIGDQVADDAVLAQLAAGTTLVLQALHRNWLPLMEFGTGLADQLGHPVQINSYVTPAQNQGFAAHYDTHDVFVLQIAGAKRWVIHEPVLEHPLIHQTWDRRRAAVAGRAAEPPLIDQVLSPGDALYLPRGYLHAATALGELSIHLTVGVHPLTGDSLIDPLIRALRDDPEIRRSLPVGVDLGDPLVLAGHLRAVADRLATGLRTPADHVTDVAAAVRTQLTAATRPAPLSPLRQLLAVDNLASDTELQCRPGLRSTVTGDSSGVRLMVLGKTVHLPSAMADAVRLLLTGIRVTPAQLPGLDGEEQLVLARRLLREGVLVPSRQLPVAAGV